MKTFIQLLLSGLSLTAVMAHAAVTANKPNVLLIISDDQGWSDFGFNGNPLVQTPAIDRLAAESARFENFVVAPACSPSRATFYTGRNHLLTGVWGVPPRANLHRDETLMPAFFKAAGYRTFYAGKSDTARLPDSSPWERGWDQGYFVSGYQHRDPTLPNRNATITPKGWTVDILTDLIVDFWKEKHEEPWFVTAAYIIPHLPWVCDEKFAAPFLSKGLSKDMSACYGSIAQLDASIARLLGALRASGQDKNTIVIFVSDNGMSDKGNDKEEMAAEDWAKRNLHHLRGHKATAWENGIRVPCLVRWPDRVAPGPRRQFGCAEDILPTLLDLAGIDPNSTKHLPFSGVSLRPALNDATMEQRHPDVFRIAIAGPGSPRDALPRNYEDHHVSLRGARFKFHALPGGSKALYDLTADPTESTDVQQTFPDVAAKMSEDCQRYWSDVIASGRAFTPPPADGAGKTRKRSAE